MASSSVWRLDEVVQFLALREIGCLVRVGVYGAADDVWRLVHRRRWGTTFDGGGRRETTGGSWYYDATRWAERCVLGGARSLASRRMEVAVDSALRTYSSAHALQVVSSGDDDPECFWVAYGAQQWQPPGGPRPPWDPGDAVRLAVCLVVNMTTAARTNVGRAEEEDDARHHTDRTVRRRIAQWATSPRRGGLSHADTPESVTRVFIDGAFLGKIRESASLDAALRQVLADLPFLPLDEARPSSLVRVLTAIAATYCETHPGCAYYSSSSSSSSSFADGGGRTGEERYATMAAAAAAAATVHLYASIMLNTDLHASSIRATHRVTVDDFVASASRTVLGQVLGPGDLHAMYTAIRDRPLPVALSHTTAHQPFNDFSSFNVDLAALRRTFVVQRRDRYPRDAASVVALLLGAFLAVLWAARTFSDQPDPLSDCAPDDRAPFGPARLAVSY